MPGRVSRGDASNCGGNTAGNVTILDNNTIDTCLLVAGESIVITSNGHLARDDEYGGAIGVPPVINELLTMPIPSFS